MVSVVVLPILFVVIALKHHELENEFAELTGRDRAILFSTGYMANQGVITALLNNKDAVFEDKWNHASLLDAGLLSGARFQRYLHNDMESLEKKMGSAAEARRKLVCVDGVFSMDGDIANLPELTNYAKNANALLMVDDAHGFGVLGDSGLGVCEHFSMGQDEVPILMCTLGKAMGSFGAIVAGSETLIETLVQFARPYIYTTSMPPAIASATRMSLRLMQDESWRREHLHEMIAFFRKEAVNAGLPLMESITPIQPLMIGDDALAVKWQQALYDKGIWISAIRPPTVPAGTARLRITLSAAHDQKQIEQLLEALVDISKQLPVGDC